MRVYKFGGASVKDAAGIRNVADIIRSGVKMHPGNKEERKGLIVVVSAMGTTTDRLIGIFKAHQKRSDYGHLLFSLQAYHIGIIKELFGANHSIFDKCSALFRDLERTLDFPARDADVFYDELLSFGEILSSTILSEYLIQAGVNARKRDAREIIKTDDEFTRASILWEQATAAAISLREMWLAADVAVTQGFIGITKQGLTTTLGREGSDFSAAVFANCFDAESLTLWKDVPGLMNADPKVVSDAEVLEEISYADAAEMMFHGANLIHTKTIQPLAAKGIPLFVRSFVDASLKGTKIHNYHRAGAEATVPIIVFKEEQARVSCRLANLEFITEQHLQQIFMILYQHFARPSMIEHTAFSVTFTLDFEFAEFNELLARLSQMYEVTYKVGLTLVTIKNGGPDAGDVMRRYENIGKVITHQHSGEIIQLLLQRVDEAVPALAAARG